MKKKGLNLVALILVGVILLSTGCGKKEEKDNKKSNVESNVNSNSNEDDNTITPAEKTTTTNKFYNLIGAQKKKEIIKGFVIDEGFLDYSGYVFDANSKEFEKDALAAILHTTTLSNMTVDKSKLDNSFSGGVNYVDKKKGIVSGVKMDFLNKMYKNVFGKDISENAYKGKTKDEDFSDCTIAYQRNLNIFVSTNGACGGVGYTSNIFYLENVVKEKGDILVKVYVGTHESSEDGEIYYKDAKGTKEFTKSDAVEPMSEKTKTQYTLYNFVFKKASDGNYYFDSVKKA